jgi:hypothetical protein
MICTACKDLGLTSTLTDTPLAADWLSLVACPDVVQVLAISSLFGEQVQSRVDSPTLLHPS